MPTIMLFCMGLVKATLLYLFLNPQTQLSTPTALPQTQAQTQPCVPASVPPKKLTLADRLKLRLEQQLEAMAQKEINKVGGDLARGTHGTLNGSVIPTLPEIVGSVPTQPKPCIVVPAASLPVGQPTAAPVAPGSPASAPQH